MCHDGSWVTLMGGCVKNGVNLGNCDGSMNSTLVLKVFQVSKYAYKRGGRGRVHRGKPKRRFNIHNRGKLRAHIGKQAGGVQAGDVSILSSSLSAKDALAGVLNGFSSSENPQSARGIWIEKRDHPSLDQRKYLWHANTAENTVVVRRQLMLQRRLMSNLQCDY